MGVMKPKPFLLENHFTVPVCLVEAMVMNELSLENLSFAAPAFQSNDNHSGAAVAIGIVTVSVVAMAKPHFLIK